MWNLRRQLLATEEDSSSYPPVNVTIGNNTCILFYAGNFSLKANSSVFIDLTNATFVIQNVDVSSSVCSDVNTTWVEQEISLFTYMWFWKLIKWNNEKLIKDKSFFFQSTQNLHFAFNILGWRLSQDHRDCSDAPSIFLYFFPCTLLSSLFVYIWSNQVSLCVILQSQRSLLALMRWSFHCKIPLKWNIASW